MVSSTYLPPVRVLSVDNVQNISFREGQASLLTGDQVVCGWAVVKVGFQVHLENKVCVTIVTASGRKKEIGGVFNNNIFRL